MFLCGCESWFLTADSITRLRNLRNKRICEILRVAMCQIFVHRITSVSLQKRTGVFSLDHCLASRILIRAGHIKHVPKTFSPKRLMLPWVSGPRLAGGQKMSYGSSLEHDLKHFGLEHADDSASAFIE